jgi:thiosulfate/3-mercaptopyruvate sulfurtransferase
MVQDGRCLVFDCRFDLNDPEAGRRGWLESHIPGARYAHLDQDLSGPVTPASGRHPLPSAHDFGRFLARSGWRPGDRVVAYDTQGGLIAARLWWLLHYFGQAGCALLDGGFEAWESAGLPLESGAFDVEATEIVKLAADERRVLTTAQVAAALRRGEVCLLDARAAERYRGEAEPLDPVAGHVPGAQNFPCDLTLVNGKMRPAGELRAAYRPFAGPDGSNSVVHMCGSGVTACLNLFAMERAGFRNNRLYAGSWSEWIRDPERPVAREQ